HQSIQTVHLAVIPPLNEVKRQAAILLAQDLMTTEEKARAGKINMMSNCSLCEASGQGMMISAAKMRVAVFDGGFDPFARGLMPSKLDTLTNYANWKNNIVALEIADWVLCERCYAAVRPHFSGDPAPIGINKEDLAYQTFSSYSISFTACGARVKPDFEYCMKCGASLREDSNSRNSRSTEHQETLPPGENNRPDEPAVVSEADRATAAQWVLKGGTLALTNESEKAIECFDRALELNPQFEEAWCLKGTALGWLGRYDEALACVDRAIELKPSFADAWFNKGVVLSEGFGRYGEALACFEEGQRLGSTRATQGIEACRKMLAEPTTAEEWIEKASGLGAANRYQEVIECCDRAIELDPTIAVAWYNKGVSLSALGRYEEAIPCYQRALELNPPGDTASFAHYYKGTALLKLNRHREALVCFEEAKRLGYSNGEKGAEACRRALGIGTQSPRRSKPQDGESLVLDMLEEKMSQRGWTPEMKALARGSLKKEMERRKGCFIATAACGSGDALAVRTLRDFRDGILSRYRAGRTIIALYGRIAPPIARWIEPRQTARWLVRSGLVVPLAFVVRRVRNRCANRQDNLSDVMAIEQDLRLLN
ncbi:MAG: tetratricopeptide repeat protein, partial [Terriglobia bacterium]